MPVKPVTTVLVAELIGGPLDGDSLRMEPDWTEWPDFSYFGLGRRYPCSREALRAAGRKAVPQNAEDDWRRAMYRFEPLANGTAQYVFDKRYNR